MDAATLREEGSLAREFSMRAEYRRCAWYVLVGLAIVFGLALFLRANGLAPQANPKRGWAELCIIPIVYLLAAGGLVVGVYCWRMRVDEIGISRRRFWKWDVWTWDEFSQGQIQLQKGRFVSSSRPLWRNYLDLSLLAGPDYEFVQQACKRFFRTEEPELAYPDERELKLSYQITKSITLRPTGVAARAHGRIQELDWSQFEQIRLFHFDEWSKRLRKIELKLPQLTLVVEGVQNVRGTDARRYRPTAPMVIPPVVEWFLLRHAPAEKVVRWSLNGPPRCAEECSYRLSRARRSCFWLTWLTRIVPVVMLALTVGCMGKNVLPLLLGQVALPNIWWQILAAMIAVLILGSQPLLVWLMLNMLRGHFAAAVKELEEWERVAGSLISQQIRGSGLLLLDSKLGQ